VTETDARERRLAANEAIARQVNEQVEQLGERWNTLDEPLEILCECSRADCTQRLHVPFAAYRAVREHDARFMLVDDHVIEEIERRVGVAGDGTVVEKFGPGHDVATATA
jgi:hypothetical protein